MRKCRGGRAARWAVWSRLLWQGVCALALIWSGPVAHALTQQEALAVAAGDNDSRAEALQKWVGQVDASKEAFLQALLNDQVWVAGERVLVVEGDAARDAATGESVKLPADAEEVVNNTRMVGEIEALLAAGKLRSPDRAVRAEGMDAIEAALDGSKLPVIDAALAQETDPVLKARLVRLQTKAQLQADDPAVRLAAAQTLAAKASPETRSVLMERLQDDAETDPAVREALTESLKAIERKLAWGEYAGVLFTGVSLGSILLLAALGLAITYGLMGVINMAHGELIMIGAYATFLVQALFRQYLPGWFDAYILLAIPASFLASALVGAVLERSVFRFLYGRPLETLLASWGISLILMQAVRSVFGAQNVQVENPAWMSGGLPVLSNLTLPYNRLAIIAFAALVLLGVTLLIARTRLGLFVRGVTQNRPMASCMGVNTARIDTLAFSLGAGIAGLAGCALSQIGNVGPDLGQGYIVDSFMVVVTGGVGQIAGTVYAALGLGMINKLLEGWSGAVLAKIMVLIMVVIFIQKRPQGLFAFKGREA
ncbi:urea ABC transporter permease subunit UrtB [Aquabacterium fontiphilum]|uniref:urea ABC transporter permease subunit UrtB n=1 Tax=Aquabacterium fontiphilum TaxID=450365 RepID=UPI0013782B00|nr:urea ABC transporter permease subunit UrtB [Aquabacterium fontiphilum]NBD19831.1 urea ABC transporter permease subunit UrtB [Aquabacterium fontiphilum]